MWSWLQNVFAMDKSLKLDTDQYPFRTCHDNCENNCIADNLNAIRTKERRSEIGIDHDHKNIFLKLVCYFNEPTHSFRHFKDRDAKLDDMLRSLCIFESHDITRLFRQFHLTSKSKLNDCPCCIDIQGRVLKLKLLNIFETSSYRYFMMHTLHGSELCFRAEELLAYGLRDEQHQAVLPNSMQKRADYYVTIPVSTFCRLIVDSLKRYVDDFRRSYRALPSAHSLMVVEKIYRNHDRREISPIGQLMDAWVLEGRHIYFLSSETICNYDHRVGLGPLQRESKWVRPEDLYLLHKFIRSKIQFHGKLVVPESSELFQSYLMKRHSPRSVTLL